MKAISICTLAVLLTVLSTGCKRDGVKVYHVDKEDGTTPPAAAPGAMTTAAGLPLPDASALPKLKYTLPDGWQEKAPSEMRVASFAVSENGKSADVSVIPMGGMAGGNLANVNRWRGQVGLGSVDEDAVQKMTEKVVIAGQDAEMFDIAGTSPNGGGAQRIIASVLHRDDTAWFFKITGDADLVEKNKPAFIALLKSFQFNESAAPAAADLSQLPPGHPPMAGTSLGNQNFLVPNASTKVTGGMVDNPTWTVPAGWQPAEPGAMLLAKFAIANAAGAQAAVNVSSLTGDGGGLVPNLTRWRGQLGLPPLTEENLSTSVSSVDLPNGKAQLVDFTGTDSKTGKPSRLVGIIVPHNGLTWFYKLMGDPDLVAAQKEAFIKFIQSAKYPDAH